MLKLFDDIAVDFAEIGDAVQQLVAAPVRHVLKHFAGHARRQKGQKNGLHLRMFIDDQGGELFRVDPFQLDHFGAYFFAIDAVQQAAGDVTAQGFTKHARQVAARGALDAALLLIVIKKPANDFRHHRLFDITEARHRLADNDNFFAGEMLEHPRTYAITHAQHEDGRLFE